MEQENVKKNIIFLDIDGVVATMRSHVGAGCSSGIIRELDLTALGLVIALAKEYDAKVVFCSTWLRDFCYSREALLKYFPEYFWQYVPEEGDALPWHVGDVTGQREPVIKDYMAHNAELIANAVCFDDSVTGGVLQNDIDDYFICFIKPNTLEGISFMDYRHADDFFRTLQRK